MGELLLDLRDLRTQYRTDGGVVRAVDGVSLSICAGETVGLVGESACGKSAMALQFLNHGLQLQERCLMLSARPAEDVAILAEALGVPARTAIEAGTLFLLEYSDFVPGRDREQNIMLPPDGFEQLREIIESQVIQRVVLDTVLPWVSLPTTDHLPDHVFSLVRAFDRLGATTLFTIPRPVSTMAHRLHRLLEDIVPVAFTLMYEQTENRRLCLCNKYLGRDDLGQGIPFEIQQGRGIVPAGTQRTPPADASPAPAAAPQPRDPEPSGSSKVRFANLILGASARPQATARPRPATSPPKANFLFSRPRPADEKPGDHA